MRDLLVVVVPLVRAGVGGGPSTPFCTATRRRDGSKLVRLIVSGPGPSGLWVRRRGSTANDEGDKGESRERERQGLEKRRREAREVDRDEQATERASKLIPKHPKIRARIYTVCQQPKGRKGNPIHSIPISTVGRLPRASLRPPPLCTFPPRLSQKGFLIPLSHIYSAHFIYTHINKQL